LISSAAYIMYQLTMGIVYNHFCISRRIFYSRMGYRWWKDTWNGIRRS